MILFWYQGHSEVSVTFSAGVTQCDFVHVDPCQVNKHCLNQPKSQCQGYLHKMSSTLFAFEKHVLFWYTVLYSVKETGCSVVQVWTKGLLNTHKKFGLCFLILMAKEVTKQTDIKLQFVVFIPHTNTSVREEFLFPKENLFDLQAQKKTRLSKELFRGLHSDLKPASYIVFSLTIKDAIAYRLKQLIFNLFAQYSLLWADIKFTVQNAATHLKNVPLDTTVSYLSTIADQRRHNVTSKHVTFTTKSSQRSLSKSMWLFVMVTGQRPSKPGEQPATNVENAVRTTHKVILDKIYELALPGVVWLDLCFSFFPFCYDDTRYLSNREKTDTKQDFGVNILIRGSDTNTDTFSGVFPCGKHFMNLTEKQHKCANFSRQVGNKNKQFHHVLLHKSVLSDILSCKHHFYNSAHDTGTNNRTFSWNESCDICVRVGGSLPILHDKNNLDDLVLLMMTSKDIPVVEALHIGLKGASTSEVRFSSVMLN